MMSASTMTFLNVAAGTTATGTAAEPAAAEGTDFTALLAALANAPAAAGKPELPLPAAAPAETDATDTVLDAEAVAALLAGMLPAAPSPPADSGELPAMTATGEDPLDASAIVEAAGSLAASMPGIEAEAAAAAAALPATPGAGQAAEPSPGAAATHPQPRIAKGTPELPQLPAAAQGAPGTTSTSSATSVAAQPATLVSASPVVNSLLAAGGAAPRDSAPGSRAVDAKAATQSLRSLMQAMGWNASAAAEGATSSPGTAAASAPPAALPEVQAPAAAAAVVDPAALDLQHAMQPELPEQAAAPSPAAAALLHANPQSAVAGSANAAEQAVRTPVGAPRWAEELGNQLVLMNARGQQEGSLTLTPEHLGPLEVRISVNQNTANVWFGAQHADTRAALAEAMPRLRELFSDAGLSLGQSGVSQEAPRQERREPGSQAVPGLHGAPAADGERDLPVTVHRLSRGLLDTYA